MFVKRQLKSDLPNLDLLRAVAVTFVIVCHLAAFLERSGDWAHALGHLGVVFFFVHTCLVLLMSLDRLASNSSGIAALRFYVRRIFRIFPLYAICIVAVVAGHVPKDPLVTYDPPRTIDMLLNLAFLQNVFGKGSVLTPLWSLPYEMQMYLVLPPIYFALRRWGWRWAAALGLYASALAVGYVLSGRLLWAWYYVPCFLCGAITYCLVRKNKPWLAPWLWPSILVAIALVYCWLRRPGFHVEALRADAIAALGVGLAIPLFRQVTNPILIRIVHSMAKYSYGIYLGHMIAMWLAFVILPLPAWPVLRVALSLAITAALSVISYHVIEEPLIRAGKLISDEIRITRSEAVQSATAA